jgi:hypothetical protein
MADITDILNLKSRDVYSIDMSNKPMTANSYYKQISIIFKHSDHLANLSTLGFYRTGQLLNRAKKELKDDFGKLKKQLQDDGLHIKSQERFMRIARNKNIELNYSKLPPQWTFWKELSKLDDAKFHRIEHLINRDVKWKEIATALKIPFSTTTTVRHPTNTKDNRTEVFGLEYDFLVATKKHKAEFSQFEKDVVALAKKYKFIRLNRKNYFDEAKDMLNEKFVKDDTSDTGSPKFVKSFQSSKKIDI